MVVTLEEMKNYLRVDFEKEPVSKIAVMYAVAYLYEHREEADHHAMVLGVRSLLSGVRKEGF